MASGMSALQVIFGENWSFFLFLILILLIWSFN